MTEVGGPLAGNLGASVISTTLTGSGSINLEVLEASFPKEFMRDLRNVARSLATTAANSIRKEITDSFKNIIIRRIMDDPDVQALQDRNSELVAALGIASSANLDAYIRGSLEKNFLDSSSSEGIGRGVTSPTKGTASSMLPLTRTGFEEGGVDDFFSSPWGIYTYTNKKKQTVEIPWLSWMKEPVGVKVPGYSVEFGDFPTSRTGNARMKRGGSFSLRRFLAGDNKNILERTLTNRGLWNTLEKKYARRLDEEMGKKSIQEKALQKAKARTVKAEADTGRKIELVAAPTSADPAKKIDVVGEVVEGIKRITKEAVKPETIAELERLQVSDPKKFITISQTLLGLK